MSPTLRSQVWKEWHERKRMLAVGMVWLLCGAVYAILYELVRHYRAPVAAYYTTCLLYGLIVPIFYAMRTSLGEVTQGTLAFTAALPVSLRRTAFVRLLSAAIALVVPMLAGAVVMSVAVGTGLVEQVPQRSLAPEDYIPLKERESLPALAAVGLLWKVTAIAAAHGVTLLFVLATIGARRRSEAVVGLIAAPIAMLWFLGIAVRVGGYENAAYEDAIWVNWTGAFLPQSLIVPASYGDEVGGYTDLVLGPPVWGPLAANLAVLAALGVWFANRYGGRPSRYATASKTRWRSLRLPAWIPNPLPGRVAALAWSDLRQALPLAVAGLMLACVMTIAELTIDRGGLHGGFVGSIAGQLPGSTWIIGTFWAAVVAAGVFGPELHPRIEEFWRSRPMSPTAWFWTKYFVGLFAVLIVLDGVTILVSWGSPYATGQNRMSIAYIACMPLIHAMMYSLAVLCVGLIRRPAAGALAAIVAFFLATFVIGTFPALMPYDPIQVYNELFFAENADAFPFRIDVEHTGANPFEYRRYLVTYGTVALIAAAASILAWRAVQIPGGVWRTMRRSRNGIAAAPSSS